jgi:hypothetical protein
MIRGRHFTGPAFQKHPVAIDGRDFRRTIEKEVNMSGKIKIGSLVLAAALVVLWAWFAYGQANQDPCGGKYAGEGLKATFLGQYLDYELHPAVPGYPATILWDSNITNGNASYYQYKVPGGDCVFLYRNGHVIVGIGWPSTDQGINHDRYVNMRFDWEAPGDCGKVSRSDPAPFMTGEVVQTKPIQFWTGNGFTASRGFQGIPGDPNYPPDANILFLTDANALLNFGALTPGQTYYFQLMVRFMVPGYNKWYRLDTQVKVYYGPFDDGSGGFGWEITPIHESYYVQPVTKVGKKLVPYGKPTKHESSVYHQELCSMPPDGLSFDACFGQFNFPFKLRLERLQ